VSGCETVSGLDSDVQLPWTSQTKLSGCPALTWAGRAGDLHRHITELGVPWGGSNRTASQTTTSREHPKHNGDGPDNLQTSSGWCWEFTDQTVRSLPAELETDTCCSRGEHGHKASLWARQIPTVPIRSKHGQIAKHRVWFRGTSALQTIQASVPITELHFTEGGGTPITTLPSQLPQEINDKSNTSQTSCGNYGWPTQTAAGSWSEHWVTLSEQAMLRSLRRGQTFCLIPVTPCLWTTLVLGCSPRRTCYYKESAELPGSWVPHKPKAKLFLALPEAQNVAETGIKQRVYSPSLLMGKTRSEVYGLHAARRESPGSASSAVKRESEGSCS